MGRKAKGEANATEWLQLRVAPTDKARIVAEANKRGQTLTVFVMRAIEAALPKPTEANDNDAT